jgi:hypothetical protein
MFLNECMLPPSFFSAIEHGRLHTGSKLRRQIEWRRLAAQGVKTGLADLFIWGPNLFAAIELKKGTTLSVAQEDFRDLLVATGHLWGFARTVIQVHDLLTGWGIKMVSDAEGIARLHDIAIASK